jgi:uncharacterized membrane protein YeaQ/YmgE (transglycosylase-associated protein family)
MTAIGRREPGEEFFSRRDLPAWPTNARVSRPLTKEPAVNVIAWIILGLAAGLFASRLIPELRSRGPALPGITGMAGAVLGGAAATILISRQFTGGFLSPATWPAALAGAAALLAARQFLTGGRREGGRRAVTVPVRRSRPPR